MDRAERIQRRFDLPVLTAALLTVPLIVIEESDYGQPWDAIGVALNWGTWLVFLGWKSRTLGLHRGAVALRRRKR